MAYTPTTATSPLAAADALPVLPLVRAVVLLLLPAPGKVARPKPWSADAAASAAALVAAWVPTPCAAVLPPLGRMYFTTTLSGTISGTCSRREGGWEGTGG